MEKRWWQWHGGAERGGRAVAAAAAVASNGRIFRSMEGERERGGGFSSEGVSQPVRRVGEISAGKSKWTKTDPLFLSLRDFSKQIAE